MDSNSSPFYRILITSIRFRGLARCYNSYEVMTQIVKVCTKFSTLFIICLIVELLSSMLNFGLGVGFLPGMIYDRLGPQWTSSIGLLVSVSAYMLIWSSTKSVKFYSGNSWLMAIYFFICGMVSFSKI